MIEGQGSLFLETDTLAEAKRAVKEGMVEGIACPCCEQFCKVYERQIHSTMAYVLINFYKMAKAEGLGDYYHVDRICPDRKGSGDFAKLAMWNMIEEREPDPSDTTRRTSGFWRITGIGINFVNNESRAARYISVYNDTIRSQSEEKVTIIDCLKERFDYQDLMGASA